MKFAVSHDEQNLIVIITIDIIQSNSKLLTTSFSLQTHPEKQELFCMRWRLFNLVWDLKVNKLKRNIW